MKSKTINKDTLLKFIEKAEHRLQGEWIIIGGAVLPLLGLSHRVTVDIDLAGPSESTQKETLVLMEIAEELGLPVEAINQAGAFFLRRIEGWEKMLVPLNSVHAERRATFFRPQATLFVLLKLGRLSVLVKQIFRIALLSLNTPGRKTNIWIVSESEKPSNKFSRTTRR